MSLSRADFPRWSLPRARPGQTVGLLGGSFDPPHEGHAHITREALKRFGLGEVWWLVTPGNPLKSAGPAPLPRRIAAANRIMRHPRVRILGIEADLRTRYTAETLAALQTLYPQVRFVWLMGADNLASFHKWEQWRQIMRIVPIGILARPGQRVAARHSRAAAAFETARLRGRNSLALPYCEPPCWCFVNVPMLDVSSSAIRARGGWHR